MFVTSANPISCQSLAEQMNAIYDSHARGEDSRPEIQKFLRDNVDRVRELAKETLLADNDGEACARALSDFQDMLITALYHFSCQHQHTGTGQQGSNVDEETVTIIATGGYGRGLLAPESDIDLLFLMPTLENEGHNKILEYVLYMLWDLGFKVGHATRTLKDCITEAKADMTICTAMLDSRLITGQQAIFDSYMARFVHDVVRGNSREFVQAKFEERDDRHQRSGDTRYQVEPNLKEDKGGMRDLHLMHWLSTYISLDDTIEKSGEDKECLVTLVNEIEAGAIEKCEQFLWTTRCHLHFLRGRPDERLSFDIQLPMASLMQYSKNAEGMQAAENFMRAYFLNAREVGDLTRIICSALEVRHLKAQPMLKRVFARLKSLSSRTAEEDKAVQLPEGFLYEYGRLNVSSGEVFSKTPVNLIHIFALAVRSGSFFHPKAYRLVRENLNLIDDSLREDREANALFLEMLMSPKYVEGTLRRMTDSGVLGRFIPDFGTIDCMMQFNMYHHYTVDDHLIRAVGLLAALDRGEMSDEHPLAYVLIQNVNRRIIYVAVLLHDIAKGRKEDHSVAGARIAHQICPRFGLSRSETEIVAWLVENHLEMSTFAQSRDISDRRTLMDFANIVQTKVRLDLLLILTVVDIRAVGPDTWNGWKGQLLRNLYYAVESHLSGQMSGGSFRERVDQEKSKLGVALGKAGWDEKRISQAVELHSSPYWLKTPHEQQVEHATLIDLAREDPQPLHTRLRINGYTDSTEVTIYRVDHPFHLMTITAACAAVGANISGAQISTTRDGMALDDIILQRSFDLDEDEMRRADRIIKLIGQVISGEKSLEDIEKLIRPPKGRISAFHVEPDVRIDNAISERFTVIEIQGLDRSGLLFRIASAMHELNIDIHSAHIATFGEKIVDVFYVTDLTGSKITGEERLVKSHKSLLGAVTLLEDHDTPNSEKVSG